MNHTNYNRISNENTKIDPVVDTTPVPNETTIEPETPIESEYVLGKVTGCTKLNVRKEPDLEADVLFVIGKDSDVLVDEEESTDEWYKVYIDEQEGFCMKKYIALIQ